MYDYRHIQPQAAPRSTPDPARLDMPALVARGRIERSRMAAHLLGRLFAWLRRAVAP